MKLKGKYWLIIGTLFYLGILIYSLSQSFENLPLISNIEIAADWITASIIYFFIGASVGSIVDRLVNKDDLPLYFDLLIFMWFIPLIMSLFLDPPFFVLPAIFPLAYGIFLTGSFYTLLPDIIKGLSHSLLIFDILFVFLFSYWLYLTLTLRKKLTQKIILWIIFIILTLGTIKAALIFF